MRAYLGFVDHAGLRWLLPEDVLPRDLLRELVLGWTSRSTTVLWAVVADEDVEAIRRELGDGRPGSACDLLSTKAVEVLPIAYVSAEPDRTLTTRAGS